MKKEGIVHFMKFRWYLLLLISFFSIKAVSQNVTVKGTVKDTQGSPVIGATVHVSGANLGTVTDVDGQYSITAPSDGTLSFTYLGMVPQTVKIGGRTTVDVVMSENSKQLNEVVVTALGIKKEEKSLGYAVSTVNASDIVKTGTPNFGTALYGKVTGVKIQAAPGGSTSAVSINVRGINSITGTNQPLIVLNGVPIRNGDANNDSYYADQRVQSNGLVDINPEDIASISILKGASASALYGSEAGNGVVLITTKSGTSGQGLGVNFDATFTADAVAYMPTYQTTFGPGYPIIDRSGSYEIGSGGFIQRSYNGQNYRSLRGTSNYFGPKYDGQNVLYYDGTERPYTAMSGDPWKDVFRTAYNQTYNVAVTQGGKKGSMRFSYTYANSQPNQYNSNYEKNNFSLTGNYSLNSRLSFDYNVNYIIQNIKNRPYRISRLTNNYSGMFGAFDNVKYIRQHTVTSQGYENVPVTSQSATPDESFAYAFGSYSLLSEYFWPVYMNNEYENDNRLIANVGLNYNILDWLRLRGRLSTDLTSERVEDDNSTTTALAIDNQTGSYSQAHSTDKIVYGDLMLLWDKKLTSKLGLTGNIGMQARTERYSLSKVATNGGLSVVNWFNLNASRLTPTATEGYSSYLRTAMFGDLGLSWDGYLYLEGTIRQEKSSTLASGKNSFYYPSVNSSFIYTQAFRDLLPKWYDYGKLRVSYGVVGISPDVYAAAKNYVQGSASGYIYNTVDPAIGNDGIKPERKYEWEFGLENKFFGDRLGFEVTYYRAVDKDQILSTTVPFSSGGQSVLMNIGELKNKGLELSVYGTPILTKNWRWDLSGNISFNKNKIDKLSDGVDVLTHSTLDNGALTIESHVGGSVGDVYSYTPKTDANGNKIVGSDGFYELTDTRVKVGNITPKATGGINSSLTYKNFTLSTTIDFRIGGAVVNIPYQYMMGIGSIKESMANRDAAHGGIQYYYPGNDFNAAPVAYSGKVPNGETVYDNGMVLKGVTEDGKANKKIIPADYWLSEVYQWGVSTHGYYSHSVFNNTYVKLRELSFGYTLPKSLSKKFACNNLTFSVFGRNLFYFYKRMPIFDAEATAGTNWQNQTQIGGSTATTRTFGVSLRASF